MFIFILAILITLFVLLLIPIYWKKYGWSNFLWFSDVGLFLTVIALWSKSSLLISMAIVGILPFELIWIIDFLFYSIFKRPLLGIADYMFDSQYSLFLRSLSLFHLVLPLIWIYLLVIWGYRPEAIFYQIILGWMIFIATYLFSPPEKNINWVFLPNKLSWRWIADFSWLLLLLIIYPILVLLVHVLISLKIYP
jgi:hypothetical protein